MNLNFKTFISLNKSILKNIADLDKSLINLGIIKIVFSVIYPLLLSIIPKVIIDSIENQVGITKLIIRIVIISVLMAGIAWINPSIHEKIAAKSEKLRINYQTELLTNLLICNYEKLSNRNTYEKAKHFVGDIGKSPVFEYAFVISDWIASIIGLLSCLVILSTNSSILLFVCIFSIIIEYFFNKKQYSNKLKMKKNMFLPNIKSDYIFRKALTTNFIRDAVVFDTTDIVKSKSIKYSRQISNELKRYNSVDSKLDILKILFIFSRDLIICLVVIQNIFIGKQNVSDFVLYFGLISVMTKWVGTYYAGQSDLTYICSSYNDYQNFNENILSSQLLCGNIEFSEIEKIELRKVSYKYGNNLALKDVNLLIRNNQKIAIVGKNGSGKSTLANILCGLFQPVSGQVFINGKEITYDEYSSIINEKISVVFQKDELLPETLYSNISFEEVYNNDKLTNSLNKTHMLKKVRELNNGVNTMLNPSINYDAPDFSGGETQRLLMSRCLYKNTKINLFDEPTASLDVKAENFVYKSITEENVLSIIISHRIANIIDSDVIIVMNDGEIVEIGTHNDLIKNKGIYYEMYKIQRKLFKS